MLDILQSIDEIYIFLGDQKDFLAYKADLKTKKAIERNIEIIGEAVNRILKIDTIFNSRMLKILLEREIELFIVMTIFLTK